MTLFLLKQIGPPGSIGFLAVGCAFGLFLIHAWPRNRRLGQWWLFALYSGYLMMGIPILAQKVAAPMEDADAGRQPAHTGTIDVLVIFDGDNAVGRVDEARRIWASAKPISIIASARPWFVERLLEAGVPRNRLFVDHASATTREQVEYVKAYVTRHPGTRVAVVASRLQMPRVLALARRADVRAQFFSSRVDREPRTSGVWRFVPQYAGLRVTRDALYELVALAYYQRQGWIGAASSSSSGRVQ